MRSQVTQVASHRHNYKAGECRWTHTSSSRGGKRKGHHPRDPRRRAAIDPTSGAPGTTAEGELGAGDEERAERENAAREGVGRGPDAAPRAARESGESASKVPEPPTDPLSD